MSCKPALPVLGALLAAAAAAGAQEAPERTPAETVARFTLIGEVRDYANERPIHGARVQVLDLDRHVITDANGFFALPDLPEGEHVFVTSSLGYETNQEASTVVEGNLMLVRLQPLPVEIEGIDVVAGSFLRRLERRRGFAPGRVWTVEADELSRTLAPDALAYVSSRFGMSIQPGFTGCPSALVRGRRTTVSLYVDEVPTVRSYFESFHPADLALVEVFLRPPMIRAYTPAFMESMARRGRFPMPLDLMATACGGGRVR